MQLTNELDVDLRAELYQVNLGRKFIGQTATILASIPDIQITASGLGLKPVLVTNILTEALQGLIRDPKLAEMDDFDIIDHVKAQFDSLLFDWARRNFLATTESVRIWFMARLDRNRRKSDFQYKQFLAQHSTAETSKPALMTNMALPAPLATLDVEGLPAHWRNKPERLVKCPNCSKVGFLTVRSEHRKDWTETRYFDGVNHGGNEFHRLRQIDETTFNALMEKYDIQRPRLGMRENSKPSVEPKPEIVIKPRPPITVQPKKHVEDFTEADVDKIFPCPKCDYKRVGVLKKRVFRYFSQKKAAYRLVIEHNKKLSPDFKDVTHNVKHVSERPLTAAELAAGPNRKPA